MSDKVLDFPFFELVDTEEATARLTINGQNERFFTGTTLEEAAENATNEIARQAGILGRPVKARVKVNRDKIIRDTVVYPDGHAEVTSSQIIEEKRPLYKKPPFIFGVAALALLACGGGAYAVYESTHAPAPVVTAPAAPANYTISEVGEQTKPLVSSDRKHVIYAQGSSVKVASADTGEEVSSLDLGETVESVTVRTMPGNGFVVVWGKHLATWTPESAFSDSKGYPSGQEQLITRSGETVTASKDNPTQPESVKVISNEAKFLAPSKGASFLYSNSDKAFWATAENGGSIVTADQNGNVLDTKKLASPAEGQELVSWAGINNNGEILSLWKSGETYLLATQKPDSDSVTSSLAVASTDSPKLSQSGDVMLLGNQAIDLASLSLVEVSGEIKDVTSKVSGFSATLDGKPVFIDKDGAHTASGGELLGFNEQSTPLVLDNNSITIDAEGNHE